MFAVSARSRRALNTPARVGFVATALVVSLGSVLSPADAAHGPHGDSRHHAQNGQHSSTGKGKHHRRHRHHHKTGGGTGTTTTTTTGTGTTTGTTSGGGTTPTPPVTPTPPAVPSLDGTRPLTGFDGPNNEWDRDVTNVPVDSNSSALVANLASQVASRYNGVAAFNYNSYNVSFFTADATTPTTTVIWDNCQGRRQVPPSLYTPAGGAHFVNVPIPANAVPSNGTDGEMTIWRPATDQLWEFWKANHQADGWHACWGGRIDNFSSNPGYFGQGMGVSASGMELASGVVGIQEMEAGSINHALRLGIPQVANYTTFSYPAQRSDGKLPLGTPNAIMEGQRFRLDPSIDVSSLNLTPIAAAIARAAQKYGFIVTDGAATVAVSTESGSGVAAATGTDPWVGMMNGVRPALIMANFPWNKLQALPANTGLGG